MANVAGMRSHDSVIMFSTHPIDSSTDVNVTLLYEKMIFVKISQI